MKSNETFTYYNRIREIKNTDAIFLSQNLFIEIL